MSAYGLCPLREAAGERMRRSCHDDAPVKKEKARRWRRARIRVIEQPLFGSDRREDHVELTAVEAGLIIADGGIGVVVDRVSGRVWR